MASSGPAQVSFKMLAAKFSELALEWGSAFSDIPSPPTPKFLK